jgi:hypothetical protein
MDLQLWHLPMAYRQCFYVHGGRSRTFSSGSSWIPDGNRWWPHHRCLQLRWWPLPDLAASTQPMVAPPSTSSTSVVAAAGPYRQHPLGGLPSTSSTSVVATAGPAASTPRGSAIDVFNFDGGRYRTLPPTHPRGLVIDVFNFGGGRYRICCQHPPEGPSSTCSTSMVAAIGPAASTPPGAPPSMSPTSKPLAPAPLGGPPSTFLSVDGEHSWTSSSGTSRGPPSTAE